MMEFIQKNNNNIQQQIDQIKLNAKSDLKKPNLKADGTLDADKLIAELRELKKNLD